MEPYPAIVVFCLWVGAVVVVFVRGFRQIGQLPPRWHSAGDGAVNVLVVMFCAAVLVGLLMLLGAACVKYLFFE